MLGLKEFYFQLCEQRRQARLSVFNMFPRQYLYKKHHVFGDCQAQFMATTHITDADFRECGPDYQMGSELCLMTISGDGNVTTEVLFDCPTGVLRDPCLPFDGAKISFSMRKNDVDDDFHLYIMNVDGTNQTELILNSKTQTKHPLNDCRSIQ